MKLFLKGSVSVVFPQKYGNVDSVQGASTSSATIKKVKKVKKCNITRNMGQDGDGHAHFNQIWRPNTTINYMGVDQNIKF